MSAAGAEATRKPLCFVVQGYKTKTDPESGRTLDLDQSYKYLIKRAAEAAGYECVRCDEVGDAGLIDKKMYSYLLEADLVVADLSTLNCNAFFELGVRYGLRPRCTLVIAENEFKSPFNTGHLTIHRYDHLGKGISVEEAERFVPELTRLCAACLAHQPNDDPDSPVYQLLHTLLPPKVNVSRGVRGPGAALSPVASSGSTYSERVERALASRLADGTRDFAATRRELQALLDERDGTVDSYLRQQLAIATYKSPDLDPEVALPAALETLKPLDPTRTTDVETIGIWAAIHKRIWSNPVFGFDVRARHLDAAIAALERGWLLKADYYNGINLAFLLDQRALAATGAERTADAQLAKRIRTRLVNELPERIASLEGLLIRGPEEDRNVTSDLYWMKASVAEAYAGLLAPDQSLEWMARAELEAPHADMFESTRAQIAEVTSLAERFQVGEGAV